MFLHEDDVVDMCSALEDFLNLRVERGQTALFEHLTAISVDTVVDLDERMDAKPVVRISANQADAVKHLQDYCRDLHAASVPTTTAGPKCDMDVVPPGRSFARAAAISSH